MGGPVFETVIASGPQELYERSAVFVSDYLSKISKTHSRISIALSGGSTPKILHEKLSTEPHRSIIPWDRVHLFWGDERFVPPDDPRSNYRMARESLIDRVPLPPENIHPVSGKGDSPEKAARIYEETLKKFFGSSSEWPKFDLVILGIGTDGHTASLFPGSPALEERTRWAVSAKADVEPKDRITLTLPVINHAERVVFLAAGGTKAAVLKDLFSGEPLPKRFPYQLIRPVKKPPVFFLDQAAAGK